MDALIDYIRRQSAAALLIFVLLIAGAFVAGAELEARGVLPWSVAGNVPAAVSEAGVDMAPFWQVWKTLDEKFVPTSTSTLPTRDEKLWGALEGLTASFGDPYTVFLPPEDAELFNDDISGNFEGVGMEIGIREGVLTVVAPLKGTPAERAGIRAGDSVFEIDGKDTTNLSVDKAVKLIRGPRGTEVTLLLGRKGEGKPFTLKVVRETIEIPTIDTTMRDDGIFIIALHSFSATAPVHFRNALREFVDANTNKLIVDLRGNPGGFIEAAVDIASWFLPAGKVVVKEDFGGVAPQRIHRSKGYNVFNDTLRMIILVDKGSASASEILAGALSEHGKARLIGEQTFGKGSVQELVEIAGDASLKVTVARWLTPNGNSISVKGLTPDESVERGKDIEKDPQLERAVGILLGEPQVYIVNEVNPFRL